ncbi:SPOR domain-containing protein [Hirschia litorea]|uniref:SPOR domain-containing protein n=1 Tax=Hirschia litorea TaxID=1199156 RepID=A0ABW2IGX4_9PROT
MTDRNSRQRVDNESAYAILPDETSGYHTPDDNNRGPMVLALTLGVIVVFAVVVWNAYKQGVRHSDASVLPQIASEGAFKVKPENPGGKADVNTNMRVLDQVGGTAREETKVLEATVREEPVPVLETVAIDANAANGLSSKNIAPSIPQASNKAQVQTQTRQLGESGKPVDLRPGSKLSGSTVQTAEIAPAPTIKKMSPAASADININPIQKPKPRPVEPAKPELTLNFSANGGFVVQLAAVKSTDAVDDVWQKAGKKAPNLFENAKRHVQTVDLGPKGVWHRVQAGSFDSRSDANVFCTAYKASGGDCIVAERK